MNTILWKPTGKLTQNKIDFITIFFLFLISKLHSFLQESFHLMRTLYCWDETLMNHQVNKCLTLSCEVWNHHLSEYHIAHFSTPFWLSYYVKILKLTKYHEPVWLWITWYFAKDYREWIKKLVDMNESWAASILLFLNTVLLQTHS